MVVKLKQIFIMLTLLLFFNGCGTGADSMNHKGLCDDFPEYSTSKYILPWAQGESYTVSQKSCGGFSHTGSYRYSYDFVMDIGTELHASRSGTVTKVKEDIDDGKMPDNHIYIQHSDGTIATYLHLTKNGSDVEEGDQVTQGQLIGRSGNSGRSTGPHLHFAVYESTLDEETNQGKTLAVSFSNTSSQIMGLENDIEYTAEGFTPDQFETE